jgi:hypothetical protein
MLSLTFGFKPCFPYFPLLAQFKTASATEFIFRQDSRTAGQTEVLKFCPTLAAKLIDFRVFSMATWAFHF